MQISLNNAEVTFDYSEIEGSLEKILTSIDDKLKDLEGRIENLREKEKILDEFIARTHGALEATSSNNFKLRSQLQNTIMKQLESMQYLIDTIIKYENIVQTYTKQKIDIQNNKVSNYARWKNINKESASEKEFLDVIRKFEEAVKGGSSTLISDDSNVATEFEKNILESTFDEGYKL